jgi:hypothetical protein
MHTRDELGSIKREEEHKPRNDTPVKRGDLVVTRLAIEANIHVISKAWG